VSKEETELLEKLRSSPNFEPQPGKAEKGFFHKVRDMFS
jgi:molecular chaperone DnaJ